MAHALQDKNFRLSTQVRPVRYEVILKVDPAAKRFEGTVRIELLLAPTEGVSTCELVLHGLELTVKEAAFVDAQGSQRATAVDVFPQSETVRFTFARALAAGGGQLQLSWEGAFCPGLRGLYDGGGVAVTQFEAADARRVFPCFDEPAFKARWQLSLVVPQTLRALANASPVEETVDGDWKTVRFGDTEVLSSYLVAFAVGELEGSTPVEVGRIRVRAWSTPTKAALTGFSQEVAQAVLPRLESYFGVPYAFGKVDQLGVPGFEAGAMENAGLITYRETLLLVDPLTAPLAVEKRAAEVITHELAHQWFGNWVTMAWWDDLWLNEAFATWMAYKVVAQWRPEWRLWLDFDQGKAAALVLDSLQSTHPIRADVHNASEATENFDLITYEKGGSVLRMLENYLGEAPFREGIRQYMKRFARANAVADDLWNALGEASGQPVLELANAWIRKPGHPVLTVSLQGRSLTLRQARFESSGRRSNDERWPIPVVLRFEDAAGLHVQRVLLRDASCTAELEGQGDVRWVCGNAGSTGFYRVEYDGTSLAALSANVGRLEVAERIGLLNDAWALFRAERLAPDALLELLAGYGQDTDYAVLDEVVARLSAVEYRLLADADVPAFRRFVETLLGPQLAAVGWESWSGEPDDQRLRRAALVRALGSVARIPSVVEEAARRMDRVLAGEKGALDPNLLDACAGMAARVGDEARFERFLAAHQTQNDPAAKRRYLMSLAAFESKALAARARELVWTPTVPTQDLASFVSGLMHNPSAQAGFWEEWRKDPSRVFGRAGAAPMILRRLVESLGALRDRSELEAVRRLFDQHPLPEQRSAIAQTLERLDQDVRLRERAQNPLGRWLSQRAVHSDAGNVRTR